MCIRDRSTADDGLVSGSGQLFGINRDLIADGDFNIPIDKIAIAESNTIQNAFNPLTPMILFTATVSAMCLGGDLHCFGSCPTFYITNGDSLVLMSEGFSLSSNPVWEESDIDALYMAKPIGTDIKLRVTNEAYETHAIRRARLFAFPRSSDKNRVFRTSDGDFYNSKLIYPTTCFAEEGDILSEILMFDNDEAGNKASIECANILPVKKVKIAKLRGKDANELLQKGEGTKIIDAVWEAKAYTPQGIIQGSDTSQSANTKPSSSPSSIRLNNVASPRLLVNRT